MLTFSSASWRLAFLGLVAVSAPVVFAQSALTPQGGEFALAPSLPGDQVFARAAVGPAGGYVVWHDNFMDGEGSGIGARRIDANFAPTLGSFVINATKDGDQEYPAMALLKGGGAVVVWQGGPLGFPKIYARFLAADGTFSTGEILVSSFTGGRQEHPQVAVLESGSVAVVWTSVDQDGSRDGVFGQLLDPSGEKIGAEFLVPQRTQLSQRSPALASLGNGRFVVVWISERELAVGSPVAGEREGYGVVGPGRLPEPYEVSVQARVFSADGPLGDEFRVNQQPHVAANPVVSATDDGGFVVVWSSHVGRVLVSGVESSHGWDVHARAFGSAGAPAGDENRLNERTVGDQFLPSLCTVGSYQLAAWISLGQDGSREGVYARVLGLGAVPQGTEFLVNDTTVGPQKMPAVASNGAGRCLVTWSGARGGVASFDVFAKRFSVSDVLGAPSKPFVTALSSARLSVTWPELAGMAVEAFEVYMDGATTPAVVNGIMWTTPALPAGSTHTFRLAYVLKDGRKSPLSEAGTGTTWGADENFDGLPDDWQARYWKADAAAWPSPAVDSDQDGATNRQEFLAGTDPTDPTKVLRLSWVKTSLGTRLHWNTEKGSIYQVQFSQDLKTWEDLGQLRFAAGTVDSVPALEQEDKAVYRVIRLR